MTSPVALIIGASRGIGRQIALTFSEAGYKVGIAAKTVENSDKLPGTIYTVSDEVEAAGGTSLPIICNVRDISQIANAVEQCKDTFGRLDLVIYNAGAIMWKKVIDTPMKRFDLMSEVNIRGAYATIQHVLPYFLERKQGRIILVSPPIYSRFFKGKIPYSVTKAGMTILTHGLGHELQHSGVTITSLWPATVIESQVTLMKDVSPRLMRKANIFADACLKIATDDNTSRINGQALIDEDYLRLRGIHDFSQYRCHFEHEPPRMIPKNFPDLRVGEEDEKKNIVNQSKL